MDNFTIAVIAGDIAVLAVFVLMIIIDKKRQPFVTGPVKPAGKRPA